jgi:hypothetical protein
VVNFVFLSVDVVPLATRSTVVPSFSVACGRDAADSDDAPRLNATSAAPVPTASERQRDLPE